MRYIFLMVMIGGLMAASSTQGRASTCENGREVSSRTEHYCLVMIDGKEVKHGVYRAMYPDGSKKIEGEYEKGLKTGTWTQWSQTGKKVESTAFMNGKKSGMSQVWSPNSGNLIYEGTYKNGKPVGTHRKWYDDGKKLSEAIFSFDGDDSVLDETHWHVNGNKKAQYHYVNGQHDGLYQRWFMDGKPQESGRYENGKRVGEWKRWNNKGEETVRTY